MRRDWTIYALSDPRTNAVRYVGWAYNPEKRLRDHISKAKKQHNHKASWLIQLERLGLRPSIEILEKGCGDWAEAERRWITHFKSQGAQLTNLTDGGEGIVGYCFSSETKQRMSDAKRGKKLSPEHVEKCAARLRGRKRPPEVVAKIVATRKNGKGWAMSESTKQKLRESLADFHHTEEAKARISIAMRGRRLSEETRQKLSDSMKGRVLTEEHKRKLSQAKIGRELSDEHKNKIRESCKHPQRCGNCGEFGHKRKTCKAPPT